MKRSKFSLFILSLLLSLSAVSQDMSINILQQPAIMNINSTGTVRIDIANEPSTLFSLPNYKICPLISVPDFVTITGVTGLPAGWKICSNDGHNIRLSNGTGTIAPLDAVTFYLNIASSTITSPATTITATLGFDGGTLASSCTNFGAPTSGNQVGNDNSTTSVGVQNFGGPQPIKIFDLFAVLNGKKVDVKWITTDEQNVSRFELERSTDATNFLAIASKKAAGNTTGKTTYPYIDDVAGVTSSVVYYRVKAIDIDGKFYYTKVVPVTLSKDNGIMVWPSPFVDHVYIKITGTAKGKAIVNLFSSTGELVRKMETKVSNGTNLIKLDGLKQLASQTYMIQVITDDKAVLNEKLIKF